MVDDICRCWDSNCRTFVLDATALPTEPQPLTNYGMDVFLKKNKQHKEPSQI